MDLLEQSGIETRHGVWKVLKRGDRICIVDHEGRMRHTSRGHMLTAQYFAGLMAQQEFTSSDTMDAGLKLYAEKFAEGTSDEEPDAITSP